MSDFALVLWYINYWRLFNAKSIFKHINSTISNNWVFRSTQNQYSTQSLKVKSVLLQIILFSISIRFRTIWSIDWILSGATTAAQSRTGSDGHKGVLNIPLSSSITGASASDCLISYPEHLLGESYPPAEMNSVYSSTGPIYVVKFWVFYVFTTQTAKMLNSSWILNLRKYVIMHHSSKLFFSQIMR